MAIKVPGEGFFTTGGVLRSDFIGGGGASAADERDPVTREAAAITAQAIADAAVVKVGTQMNVGGTGFDAGVADLVEDATLLGLQHQRGQQPALQIPIGGTYQDTVMAGSRTPPPPPSGGEKTGPPENSGNKNKDGEHESKGKAVGRGGSYQDEILYGSGKAKKVSGNQDVLA